MTSLLAKELERIISPWIKDIIRERIGDLQFGNAKGVSTTPMLVRMLDTWQKAPDTPNTSVRVIFLDFSKALDRINHNILLDKFQELDTPPCFLKWLAAFLHKRSQSVKIGDIESSALDVNEAVPQGSYLARMIHRYDR